MEQFYPHNWGGEDPAPAPLPYRVSTDELRKWGMEDDVWESHGAVLVEKIHRQLTDIASKSGSVAMVGAEVNDASQ